MLREAGAPSTDGREQPSAQMAVAAEQDRARDRNGKSKAKSGDDAAFWPSAQVQQINLGPRKRPSFALGNHVVQQR